MPFLPVGRFMLQTAPLLGECGSRIRWMNSVSEQGSIPRQCCLGTLLGIWAAPDLF